MSRVERLAPVALTARTEPASAGWVRADIAALGNDRSRFSILDMLCPNPSIRKRPEVHPCNQDSN
jgi:hypothetical protein